MKLHTDSSTSKNLPHSEAERKYCCNGSSPDDIVITGMSGRFPLTDTIEELSEGLYNKKEFIKDCLEERWPKGCLRLPHSYAGLLNDLEKFDANFFGLSAVVSKSIEPDQRLLMEVSYEAICDAGYDPHNLRGRNIAVYSASSSEDSKLTFIFHYNPDMDKFIGYQKSLRANRFSYAMDFRGNSCVVDTACSSSAVALALAYSDIQDGRCEAAIVNGSQLILSPEEHSSYMKGGILSKSGICRPFDHDADGITRSESSCAIFLQKASAARRIYATVVHTKAVSSGYIAEGPYVPSTRAEIDLFRECLRDTNMSPLDIDYVEAHGTGTPVGDPIEIHTLSEVYCEGRDKPLPVGSIKSNIGHTEAPSAICGIIKTILAFETGVLAPNISYSSPFPKCHALIDGRVRVVTEPEPFTGTFAVVNSFGFGGTLAHAILKRNIAPKTEEEKQQGIPQLTLYSATTEDGVKYAFDYIQRNKPDRGFYALLHNLAHSSPVYKPYRGFSLMLEPEQVVEIQHTHAKKREIWYIMTGMGCQWPGMACDLMQIEVFANSMKRSAKLLEQFGIDLFALIQPNTNHLLQKKKITPAFVSLAAIQIALIDVMNSLGIVPDGIIGHSVGELACSYADGCCTAEQTLLAAYWRGKATESSNLPDGAMAAVGMTWEDTKKACPKDVYAACHNSRDSVTISGALEPVEKFVAKLQQENQFVRIVDAYGYGFHCPFVSKAGPSLRAALDKLFLHPKQRTKRWLSTSVPVENWEKPESTMADANYFVRNLLSPVKFAEALAFVPPDAIVIEIGAHCLLQSILKRAIGLKASYFGLMKRNENNVKFLLSSIGKLYTLGVNPQIENLYPPINYPVPRGTACVSSLIKWDHSVTWPLRKWIQDSGCVSEIILKTDSTDRYLLDHCVEGRTLYPAAGYVISAWTALATVLHKSLEEVPVLVEDFKIHRATILSPTDPKALNVSILNVGGDFEISDGKAVVATGKISSPPDLDFHTLDCSQYDSETMISGKDLYSEMRIRGYEFGPEFRCLDEMNIDGSHGFVRWSEKWTSYLDAHFVFFDMITTVDTLFLPTRAFSIKINPQKVMDHIEQLPKSGVKRLPVTYEKYKKVCMSPGIEIRRLKLEAVAHRAVSGKLPTLEKYNFVPYFNPCCINTNQKQECVEYIDVCSEMAKKIALSCTKLLSKKNSVSKYISNGASKGLVDNYLHSVHEYHALLHILKQVTELPHDQFIKSLNGIFKDYMKNIRKDILCQALLNENPLRPALDIIAENSARKINAIEICNEQMPVLPKVYDLMNQVNSFKIKGTLVHYGSDTFAQELCAQRNIEVVSAQSHKYLENIKEKDLIISSFSFGKLGCFQSHLRFLTSLCRAGGFILLFHREHVTPAEAFLFAICEEVLEMQSADNVEKVFTEEKLTVISKVSDSLGSVMYLLRWNPDKVTYDDSVVEVKLECYNQWVEKLKETLSAVSYIPNARIWLMAEDDSCNGILGLVRCLKQEPGSEKIRCVFIMKDANSSCPPKFSVNEPFYADVLQKDLFLNIYQNKKWGSFRHTSVDCSAKSKKVEHCYLNCTKYGDLSSFKWIESSCNYELDIDGKSELVHVVYSALNFKDVMLATAKVNAGAASEELGNDPCVLGLEFSGVLSDGRRVMGATANRAMATTIYRQPLFMMEIPDNWTLEDAATVPVVYGTSYYALLVRGQLSKGDSILIHSGSGGIGIASIRIALSMNCEVFTTVGTQEKRAYLKKLFPQIKDENIGSSRDTTFEDMIFERTKGRGVDLVLNSLADDKLQASTRCLAKNGRFLEIGKYDLALDHKLGLGTFLENTTFNGVFFDKVFQTGNGIRSYLHNLLAEGIRNGVVKPLDRTVFQADEAEQAFRYMGSGKHVGKVLLKIRDEPKKGSVPAPLILPSVPCTYFYKHKVYIIVGGLGGFGIELTKWMTARGAHNIILTSRFGTKVPFQRLCMKRWKDKGYNVTVSCLNVAKKNEARQLLEEASKIGPVGGIFNSAVVLKDGFLGNQKPEYFEEVCAPKAAATKYLDELSRELCPLLDWFVCFSSISCGFGNAGQTNYGYANSVMERVCERRKNDGLHGLAIQWGLISEVGVAHRQMGEDAMIAGVMGQKVTSCLETLEKFLQQDHPVVSSYVSAGTSGSASGSEDLLTKLAKILDLKDSSELDMNRSFREMGIDSIIGVELQHSLESDFDIILSIQQIQDMKISDVVALVEASGTKKSSRPHHEEINRDADTVDPSQIVPKYAAVPLNSKPSGVPVFLVHYYESELAKLNEFISDLDCTCFALLCPASTPREDITTMAASYLQEAYKWNSTVPIHLIGYSSSACLAFEMAAIASTSPDFPEVKTLTILDGSSHMLNAVSNLSKNEKDKISEVERNQSILQEFVAHFTKNDILKKEEFMQLEDYDSQIDSVANTLVSVWPSELNKAEVEEAARHFVEVKKLMNDYQPTKKYDGDIVIVESTGNMLANDVSVVNSELSKICKGKVLINRIPGGNKYLIEKESAFKAAEVLNEMFESKMAA